MAPFSHAPLFCSSSLTSCVDPVQETFLKAKEWVKELGRHITGDVVISLAGNKSDLGNLRMVPTKVEFLLSFTPK